MKHLQAIHAYIFQDVYDWAGELRKVDIAKGNMFCIRSGKATAFEAAGKQDCDCVA
ncbi:MAG: Fic family protein [Butyrivibrio sp.]|nr:Fic family protein [Butyrivibrio sp.]